jgi:protein SCO1/2
MRNLIVVWALLALAWPAAAHSLDDVQADLAGREPYVAFEPGIGSPFPDFHLTDADNKPLESADLKGKVVVLDFIYASCTDVCPLQSELVAQVQKDVATAHMSDRVRFISITVDPERDSAAVRKAYGRAHGLDPFNWTFAATSTGEEARALAEKVGLKIVPNADGSFGHAVVTYVIDDDGKLRARFFGLRFNPLNAVIYINALVNDPHHHETQPDGSSSVSSAWAWLKSFL